MAERLKAAVLKTAGHVVFRGFESLFLRNNKHERTSTSA